MFLLWFAEASCRSQIATARAVSSEFGEDQTHKSGIQDWARIGDRNSERDVNRVVSKHGTTLPVPITEIAIKNQTIPWISPKNWLQYIVDHSLVYMLSGLSYETKNQVGWTWREFWSKWRTLNPDFDLFYKDDFDPSTTIGLYVHGDEGRTLKKNALMVTSLQSILGHGFNEKRMKRDRDGEKLQVNFAGHTAMTRFVISVLPKVTYQSDPEVFHTFIDKVAEELKDLLEIGLRDSLTGVTYKFVVLGVKGDMPYLQKVGRLKRSWNTTVKRGQQRKEPPGVCHLCLAGTPMYPCEDTSHKPCWAPTIGVKVPWSATPGILKCLPHDRVHPGSHFKADLWHCIHLGIGKSFISSTVHLALDLVPASNNDERFEWLTDHYVRWCRSVQTCTYVSKISAYLISYNDARGASGNWSKGSLTRNLMRWLVALLNDLRPNRGHLLLVAKRAAMDLNVLLSFLYNAALFLDRDECNFVYKKGMCFLQTYTDLATKLFNLGRPHLFPLFPKGHAVHHIWYTIYLDSIEYGFSMNPLSASCQQDEDTVGRTSRLSRRVSVKLTMRRTLERHLLTCYKVWKDAKLIMWKRCGKGMGQVGHDERWTGSKSFHWWLSNMMKTSDFGKPGYSKKTWFFCHDHKKEGSRGWRCIYIYMYI